MKKLIQVCSFLTLVFAFTAVSANAQSTYGSEVEIPFAFSVRDRSYEPGKYIVKLTKQESGVAVLTISDPKTDRVQTILTSRGSDNYANAVKLVFDNANGARVLRRILTPSGDFALRLNGDETRAAQNLEAVVRLHSAN